MSRDSSQRKGDVEWLFAFSRRVQALPHHLLADATVILDELASIELESSDRFQEIDESLKIMLLALAETARQRQRG